MTAIPIQEVQFLIDRFAAYGIDRHSRDALAELKTDDFGKHLLTRDETEKLITNYTMIRYEEIHGAAPRMQKQRERIVRTEEAGLIIKYDRDNILNMLEHKYVQKKLAAVFDEMTTEVAGIYIPTVISEKHPYQQPKQPHGGFWI